MIGGGRARNGDRGRFPTFGTVPRARNMTGRLQEGRWVSLGQGMAKGKKNMGRDREGTGETGEPGT